MLQKIKEGSFVLTGVMLCLAGIAWLVNNKHTLPDDFEPVVVSEMEPIWDADRRDAWNWAVRNIPFYWDEWCAEGAPRECSRIRSRRSTTHTSMASGMPMNLRP